MNPNPTPQGISLGIEIHPNTIGIKLCGHLVKNVTRDIITTIYVKTQSDSSSYFVMIFKGC